MSSIKKLSNFKLYLTIAAGILLLSNYIIVNTYLRESLITATYKYAIIYKFAYIVNFIIIVIAFILKKKMDNMYRTLSLIMIGVCNILYSLSAIFAKNILAMIGFNILAGLAFLLLAAFVSQSGDD